MNWRALLTAWRTRAEPRIDLTPPPHVALGSQADLQARAASRARWLKAAAHAAGERAGVAADEARRADPTDTAGCSLWRYAYEQRTGEVTALRTALKHLLATIPVIED